MKASSLMKTLVANAIMQKISLTKTIIYITILLIVNGEPIDIID